MGLRRKQQTRLWALGQIRRAGVDSWPGKPLDSHFKCDTKVGGEGFDRGSVAEAFSRRRVEVPDDIVDVGIGVLREGGLVGELAAETAVGVLESATLPGLCGSQK